MTDATIFAPGVTVEVLDSAPPSGGPAWLADKPLNAWLPVGTQSAMGQMDFAPLIAAGLCGLNGVDIGYGSPSSKTCLLYTGATLRKADSDFLTFGGGGARAWAGNEIRGLRLSEDNPRWTARRNPSPSSDVWLNSYHNTLGPSGQTPDPTNSYMRDGITPNARHEYWHTQFHDASDSFYALGIGPMYSSAKTNAVRYIA